MDINIQEVAIYIVLGLMGAIGHILKDLTMLEKQEGFDSLKWLKSNLFSLIYGSFIVIPTIFILYEAGQLNIAAAVLVGYTGDSVINSKKKKFKDGVK